MLYSPSTNGFYTPEVHGGNIPDDAVSITGDQYDALMLAQSEGKIIQAGKDGLPAAMDRPKPTKAQMEKNARAIRDAKLAATDWTQGRDIPEAVSAAWAPYRQALRDISNQPDFPADVKWPEQPK